MRWRLHVEYDGAPFAGWQLQPGILTVQGALETAAAAIVGHPVRISGAGRTDSGVHARMQVATFDTTSVRSPSSIRDGLNAHLPPAVAVVAAAQVDSTFDPRRAPHQKTYLYRFLTGPTRSPLRLGRVWRVDKVDAAAMAAAVAPLVGTHDWSAFRAQGCSARTTVRTVSQASVTLADDEVHLVLEGTGFLRHSVRIVAGSLVEVGRGRRTPEWLLEVFRGGDRAKAGPTAPAEGLILERIVYAVPA